MCVVFARYTYYQHSLKLEDITAMPSRRMVPMPNLVQGRKDGPHVGFSLLEFDAPSGLPDHGTMMTRIRGRGCKDNKLRLNLGD